MELIVTTLLLPSDDPARPAMNYQRQVMAPRLHAGESLMMIVDGVACILNVTHVTLVEAAASHQDRRFEQMVKVTFDTPDDYHPFAGTKRVKVLDDGQ